MSIDYQAVSIAVVLRDYIDDLQYINEEHRRLADIADTLYNAGISVENWNDNPEYNYKALYAKYSKDYWDKVLKDISALDSQIDAYNAEDLELDYKYMLKRGADE